MIKLLAHNEQDDGFETEVHIDGDGALITQQLTALFDRIYEAVPLVFELALVESKFTQDHT